jgi:hypothetical protein
MKLDDDFQNSYYTWPKPSQDSELFRYETCKEVLAALTQASSEHQARGKLKTSYMEWFIPFCTKVSEDIGQLVELDKEKKTSLKDLITQAVTLWLILCTQHIRLFVVLPGSDSTDQSTKIKLAEGKKLRLITFPEVQRYGNDVGLNLEEKVVITKGQTQDPNATE